MSRRLTLFVVAFALLLVACTSEGLPADYPDQDARAERQFREACEEALADSDQDDVPQYCECAFHTVAANLTFAQFLDLDEKLKNDPASLSLEEQRLFDSVSLPCAFTAADAQTTIPAS